MELKDINQPYFCPFCGNELNTRYSKCFNIYCKGKTFHKNNLVIYRLNHKLGIGRIIKKLEIPASKSLEESDSYTIQKYKVKFNNNIIKIIHPIDLIHFLFKLNDKIFIKGEEKDIYGIVNSADIVIKEGNISYEVLYSNGKLTQVDESEIFIKNKSFIEDIPLIKPLSPPKTFFIKYWAHNFYSYYTSHQLKCITNSRLSLMPHQINVAHRLAEDYFPRMILADEVGLGKTIEAGIYIKEMIARNIAERILLIVPASLVRQWKFEMENKFNITFIQYDGRKIKKLKKKGSYKYTHTLQNPFYYDNFIICSLQFARNPKYIHLLSQISWDIVVFDEAHHLRRYLLNKSTGNYRETLNYQLARYLSQTTESLLLLTATPLQLHSFELYSLIELIHPEAFENFSDFEHFRKNIPFINLLNKNLNQLEHLNTFEVKNTIKLLKDMGYVNRDKSISRIKKKLTDESIKKRILTQLENDHTLSHYLIRNRKKNVISDDYINERVVKTIVVDPKKEELDLYNEIRLYLAKIYNLAGNARNKNLGFGFVITILQKLLTSSKFAFLKSLEKRLLTLEQLKEEDPDYYISELESNILDQNGKGIDQIDKNVRSLENQEIILREFYKKLKALPYDSKSEKLLELLEKIYQKNPQEKILIFTQFVNTLKFLRKKIKEKYPTFFIESFYGERSKDQKALAVKRFRRSKGFSLLLSTEIGGEGRNFQFCRTLINYDLPWNPMKLEQRIGRLDRIGQKSKKIYIYNFFMEGTIETDIVFALNKRINLFKESIGKLEPILGSIESEIKQMVFAPEKNKQEQISEFNRNVEDKVKKAEEMQLQLDDLLIDEKSFQMDSLVNYNSPNNEILNNNDLFNFIFQFFSLANNKYGKISIIKDSNENQKEKKKNESNKIIKIALSNTFLNKIKQNLQREYIGTFSSNLAREREEINFFALGHPLINEIIKFCMRDAFPGEYSAVNLKKALIPSRYKNKIKDIDQSFLIIFQLTFQGYIVEYKIKPILLNEKGEKILDDLPEFLLNFKKNNQIYQKTIKKEDLKTQNLSFIKEVIQEGRKVIQSDLIQWKTSIINLNDKIFQNEKKRKNKLYKHKKKILSEKLASLKKKLQQKKNQFPSEEKIKKINNLAEQEKREKKMRKLKKQQENIRFLEKDIDLINKKVDDLEFHHRDLINDMQKQNKQIISIKLLSLLKLTICN
jgi:SNF2 family DNA or RNA helicase